MTQVFGKLKLNNFIKKPKRFGHGSNYSSAARKKVTAKDKALAHFDDLYQSIYGAMWPHIRAALLREDHKYIAIVNNFGNTEDTIEKLQLLGAMNLKDLYDIHGENKKERDRRKVEQNIPIENNTNDENDKNTYNSIQSKLKIESKKKIQSYFPENYEASDEIIKSNKAKEDEEEEEFENKKLLSSTTMRSLEHDLEKMTPDESRIIKPSLGLTISALHEYIPATKIKGLDDYVLESEHYEYYTKAADFEIQVEEESVLNFPKYLKAFTFESGNDSLFPSPRRTTDVLDYYLLDGASILPVLALGLNTGDRVLDMCAAPGGKSLIALQTLLPHVLVANDVKTNRLNHLNQIMKDYLGSLDNWPGKLYLTNHDARDIDDKELYNKILVDVPCTTDRHMLHEDDNNWFKAGRIKERLKLPELQTQILTQALKIIAPGGTVVYSTCTLSPVQNDGIVQLALKRCYEETKSTMIVKNIDQALAPLRFLYKFGTTFGFKYGSIVLPTRKNNWGPMYFSKIVRIK